MSQDAAVAEVKSSGKRVALSLGRGGVLGVKAGMTQVYNEKGKALAVTVIDLQPNRVTDVRTQSKNGYSAVQVGLIEKKEKSVNKAERGHAIKAGAPGFRVMQEFRMPNDEALEGVSIGDTITAEFLQPGDLVDLTAVSKGKGFQGVMKRHGFAGQNASHGVSVSHRAPGSIGNRADPAKVFKNKRMAGHMGHKKVTIQNVQVVAVDHEKGLLLVHGCVPGPKSSVVRVSKAVKTYNKSLQA